jgi:catechol 2,3-dioxygenase-like lactoylglutathione lyase family enzyme
MAKKVSFELSGPTFIGIYVKDVKAAAEFYQKKLGFKPFPFNFPNAVQFLTYPIPFAVIQLPQGNDLDQIKRPITTPQILFKTKDSKIVYDALVELGVEIFKPLKEGPFGKEFTFVDLDGYAIRIYDSDIPNSITIE